MRTLSLSLSEQLMVLRLFQGIPHASLAKWEWIEKAREMLAAAETDAKVKTGEVIDNKIYKALQKKNNEFSDVEFPDEMFDIIHGIFKEADRQEKVGEEFLPLVRKFLQSEKPKE